MKNQVRGNETSKVNFITLLQGARKFAKTYPEYLNDSSREVFGSSTHATTGEGCATRAAREAIDREFDIVIAAGGDGTLYEVINGLSEIEKRPVLGIIPGGTSNDFARALGIPYNGKRHAKSS